MGSRLDFDNCACSFLENDTCEMINDHTSYGLVHHLFLALQNNTCRWCIFWHQSSNARLYHSYPPPLQHRATQTELEVGLT
jgi:hypothetical protein